MVDKKNILRQITDIQVQAERLIKNKADLVEIQQFSDYSTEIKAFLLENIDDDFILGYLNNIPDLDLNDLNQDGNGIINLILNFISGGLSAYSAERRKSEQALQKIRDIRGKYASAEFMLKNYFS